MLKLLQATTYIIAVTSSNINLTKVQYPIAYHYIVASTHPFQIGILQYRTF